MVNEAKPDENVKAYLALSNEARQVSKDFPIENNSLNLLIDYL